MPRPLQVDLLTLTLKVVSESRDLVYLRANFRMGLGKDSAPSQECLQFKIFKVKAVQSGAFSQHF